MLEGKKVLKNTSSGILNVLMIKNVCHQNLLILNLVIHLAIIKQQQ